MYVCSCICLWNCICSGFYIFCGVRVLGFLVFSFFSSCLTSPSASAAASAAAAFRSAARILDKSGFASP